MVVPRFERLVVGVSLGQGDSLTGLNVPSRNRWGSGMSSMLLLRLTPVRWVLVLERNTFCFSFKFWCRSDYFTMYDDSFSCSGGVDPGIAPYTIHSFCSCLFTTVDTERVCVVNLVFCYDFE